MAAPGCVAVAKNDVGESVMSTLRMYGASPCAVQSRAMSRRGVSLMVSTIVDT
jgi:hypothetical protein